MIEPIVEFVRRTGIPNKAFNYLLIKGYINEEAIRDGQIEMEKAFGHLWTRQDRPAGLPPKDNNIEHHVILLSEAIDIMNRCYYELPLNSEQEEMISHILTQLQHLHKKAVIGE